MRGRPAVVVGGCRTPFLRSETAFIDLMGYELGAHALSGLLARTGVDPARVDRVILGNVIQEVRTSNVAREASLACGLPDAVPAMTLTSACASANAAIASGAEAIACGEADVVIAGGVEVLSDVPIRFRRPVRKRLIASRRAKGMGDWLKLLRGLRPGDLAPEAPAIAEFSTDLTMGDNAERLAKRFGISREAQDAFAMRSHHLAAEAAAAGRYQRQIVPVPAPPGYGAVSADNGVRADSRIEKLATLSPVFDRKLGTVTAGNSSFLTDGAAACLLASEERAKELGLAPLARVAASAFVGVDPLEELLLGPVVAVPAALDRAGIGLDEVGVFEVHEAFSAPVLALVQLLADEEFCRKRLGRNGAVGTIPMEKLNRWGGSLSLGHPFGATGARLVMTCAERMEAEGARWGVVTACAAGGLGHAMVLERVAS